ncbi:MAG: hypothetical protein P4L55_21610 [Syntrophobacteraceae bacterium]|nr:hypothetical protein [Syntrophobacteraceae bacterium]
MRRCKNTSPARIRTVKRNAREMADTLGVSEYAGICLRRNIGKELLQAGKKPDFQR